MEKERLRKLADASRILQKIPPEELVASIRADRDEGCGAKQRVIDMLKNPPDLGKVEGKLSRDEIY